MKIEEYIKRHISDSLIIELLENLSKSKDLNHILLAYCIAIEHKNGLIPESLIKKHCVSIKSKGNKLNFDSYTNEIKDKKHLSIPSNPKDTRLARVVDKDTFNNYIGSWRFNNPIIDKVKIVDEKKGWSTANGIVWVTPFDEIQSVWESSKSKPYPANDICDHLGFPRDYDDLEYIRIDYSPNFPDLVYQPNSTNRLWHYEYNLFLSFIKSDGFGRTYNQNSVVNAREKTHEKSMFYDTEFEAEYLGRSSSTTSINDKIIEQAKLRLAK